MVVYIGNHLFRCGICNEKIKANETIFQDNTHLVVVCSTCKTIFPKEDVALVVGIFLSHGGYFGKLKYSSPKHSIKDLLIKYRKEQKLNMDKIQILLLHRALLYGITPKQFNKQLELLIK